MKRIKKKLLVLGASGFLGEKIMKLLSKKYSVKGTYFSKKKKGLKKLNLLDKKAVLLSLKKEKPSAVLLPGGITNVDLCEKEKKQAYDVNVSGVRNVVEACKQAGCKLVYYSTDYVFDGSGKLYSESDAVNPLSYYAKTKLLGEKIVQGYENSLILRVAVLYGYNSPQDKNNFFKFVYSSLKQGKKIKVFADQFAAPTLIDDIALATAELLEKNSKGIFHVCGSERISRAEFAEKIAEVFGLDPSLLEKIPSTEFRQLAARPMDSSMSISRLQKEGIKMSSIKEGLLKVKEQMGEFA